MNSLTVVLYGSKYLIISMITCIPREHAVFFLLKKCQVSETGSTTSPQT
uniref:Uncharacterized protein n=1 Tax=Arundo donax TaxID=35708 RepID=A0A0A9BVT1_ARUDO